MDDLEATDEGFYVHKFVKRYHHHYPFQVVTCYN